MASAGEAGGRIRVGGGGRGSNRRSGDDAVCTLLLREFGPTCSADEDAAAAAKERRRRRRKREEEAEALIRRCFDDAARGGSDNESGEASEDTEFVKRCLDRVIARQHGRRERLWSRFRRSRSCEPIMLAPPVLLTTPDGGTGEVSGRATRSNSCVGEEGPAPAAFLLRAGPAAAATGSRRASALSAKSIAAVAAAAANESGGGRLQHAGGGGGGGGRKAFLLRQRSTGEEVVVTMAAMGSPVKGARTVVSQVPTYVTTGAAAAAAKGSGPRARQGGRKTSFDDHQVTYDSLMTPADYSRRFSEMVHSQDVLLQNHLEKIYQKFRSSRGSDADEADLAADGAEMTAVPPPPPRKRKQDRLDDWLVEMERRKRRPSCALGEFGRQAAASAKGPLPMPAAAQRHLAAAPSTKSLPKSPQHERLYRSSSQAGAAGLDLPPSGGVAGLRRGSHCPLGRAASSDVPRRGSFNRGGSKRHHRKGSSSKEIPLMRIRQAPIAFT